MDDNKDFTKVLKWAGIIALIAVPVFMVLRKRKEKDTEFDGDDDSNIFASELSE